MTKLRKWIRSKRLAHDELLYDMAKRIGVSSSTLSAIENQKVYADIEVFAYLLHEYADSKEDAILLGEAFDEHVEMELIPKETPNGVCYVSKAHVDEGHCDCNECRLARTNENEVEASHGRNPADERY